MEPTVSFTCFLISKITVAVANVKPVPVKLFMPIYAKELFIKENVVKTLMKRKAVKRILFYI